MSKRSPSLQLVVSAVAMPCFCAGARVQGTHQFTGRSGLTIGGPHRAPQRAPAIIGYQCSSFMMVWCSQGTTEGACKERPSTVLSFAAAPIRGRSSEHLLCPEAQEPCQHDAASQTDISTLWDEWSGVQHVQQGGCIPVGVHLVGLASGLCNPGARAWRVGTRRLSLCSSCNPSNRGQGTSKSGVDFAGPMDSIVEMRSSSSSSDPHAECWTSASMTRNRSGAQGTTKCPEERGLAPNYSQRAEAGGRWESAAAYPTPSNSTCGAPLAPNCGGGPSAHTYPGPSVHTPPRGPQCTHTRLISAVELWICRNLPGPATSCCWAITRFFQLRKRTWRHRGHAFACSAHQVLCAPPQGGSLAGCDPEAPPPSLTQTQGAGGSAGQPLGSPGGVGGYTNTRTSK